MTALAKELADIPKSSINAMTTANLAPNAPSSWRSRASAARKLLRISLVGSQKFVADYLAARS
jgi:hypothetical protein